MNDSVRAILSTFRNSEPVFVAKNENRDMTDYVSFDVQNAYHPNDDLPPGDPLETIAINLWSESFDRSSFSFKTSDRLQESIRDSLELKIKKAFISASALKNPQQSKLYKFLCGFRCDSLYKQELYVSLLRYIHPYIEPSKVQFHSGSDCPHAKNLVAILEKVKDKYERE